MNRLLAMVTRRGVRRIIAVALDLTSDLLGEVAIEVYPEGLTEEDEEHADPPPWYRQVSA